MLTIHYVRTFQTANYQNEASWLIVYYHPEFLQDQRFERGKWDKDLTTETKKITGRPRKIKPETSCVRTLPSSKGNISLAHYIGDLNKFKQYVKYQKHSLSKKKNKVYVITSTDTLNNIKVRANEKSNKKIYSEQE